MYKVINFFTDLQDGNHAYNVGDVFPREGVEVSKERLAELSSSNNQQGKPLIEKVKKTPAKKSTSKIERGGLNAQQSKVVSRDNGQQH